jgi:hypothetical protein
MLCVLAALLVVEGTVRDDFKGREKGCVGCVARALKPAGERIDIHAESLCERLLATEGFGRPHKRASFRGCHAHLGALSPEKKSK